MLENSSRNWIEYTAFCEKYDWRCSNCCGTLILSALMSVDTLSGKCAFLFNYWLL